jgi:fumarylpyruvate hydrolase
VSDLQFVGGGRFAVRRIYCVGLNYRAHIREMGGNPDREAPFFFQKPTDAILPDGATLPYPPRTANLHHEVELVVAIGTGGVDVPVAHAAALIAGYAVGLDMTRRDLQAEAKKAGRPWDMAKGFDHSAPCGALTPAAEAQGLDHAAIWLDVNGERRQSSELSHMIWRVPEVIAELSRYMTLAPGDLIFTGTPENVGPVQRGDRLHAHIDGLSDLRITVG